MRSRADDDELIAKLRARDKDAFAALVRELHGGLVRVALLFVKSRATAEEVAQDTWGNLLASLDQFEGRSSLRTWIFRICTNRAKTMARRESRSTPLAELEEPGEEAVDPSRFNAAGRWSDPPQAWEDDTPERVLDRAESIEEIQRTLAQMPAMQRAVITLRDVQGLESVEVCNALEISESNQRVLLHRARSRVRRALERLHAEREEVHADLPEDDQADDRLSRRQIAVDGLGPLPDARRDVQALPRIPPADQALRGNARQDARRASPERSSGIAAGTFRKPG